MKVSTQKTFQSKDDSNGDFSPKKLNLKPINDLYNDSCFCIPQNENDDPSVTKVNQCNELSILDENTDIKRLVSI